ncbi:MAG: isoleucine--tRNA ligase [Planctomycetaceae bacterium]|nr:isoleucine--tRNA ligase [Planctomycetaceae bacterium]
MFKTVSTNPDFPNLEKDVLRQWKDGDLYNKTLANRANGPRFVFYEGPPTANGMPHPGHCLTRAIKDLYPRYKTMKGFLCERKAGWDTHGLPVEVEVCKELGIHSKEEIEAYGIEKFIHKCHESVWRYMREWEELTERLGFWVDLDQAYVTYHQSYVESVWWSLKVLFDKGMLYRGHKIVWWWAQGGTALSAGEVGQGYRETADPSVYVEFPLVEQPDVSLLIWTTTPWTLPSNQFAAVHPDLTYAYAHDNDSGKTFIVAADLVASLSDKFKLELEVQKTCLGADLVGQRYTPPFDFYFGNQAEDTGVLLDGTTQHVAWRVVAADFVTTASGTGVVHQAPAFGEIDYDVLVDQQNRFIEGQGPSLICAVGPDGKFTEEASIYAGRWVKEADKDICRELREKGLLVLLDQVLHDYPFCWRADEDPLIQYPRESWFIRTTEFKDELLSNNQKINWQPEHIKDGRFGNFLESNVDWSLSRERYWGTPLPIWECQKTGKREAVACYHEVIDKPGATGMEVWEAAKAETPDLSEHLKVHKPYIDAITYDSPFCDGSRMQRVPEVIDCWYDSGAMPFAQWGYPHQGADQFKEQFPADFISEAIDQTRGWFYSQLAISTMLFGETGVEFGSSKEYPHPYRNCVVLGLMLGEDGRKMSKSKRNYREPNEIFNKFGADALRWYFFANQAPWTPIRYKEQSIKESMPEFILRLWNVYSFFTIYGNIDGFDPGGSLTNCIDQLRPDEFVAAHGYRSIAQRDELDRWAISELQMTVAKVTSSMDRFDNYGAALAINRFVDGLSNWFVRRSRDRFWAADKEDQSKLDGYWTLYECLVTLTKLIAPFVPFLSETIWNGLSGIYGGAARESVHLCDYPVADTTLVDETLSARMATLREIASLGRSARMNAKLKVRQPLLGVEVILVDTKHQDWLESHDLLLREELNVKSISYSTSGDEYITYVVSPNFQLLGPRLGPFLPQVKIALATADGGVLLGQLESAGQVVLTLDSEEVVLKPDEIQVGLAAKDGWAAAQGDNCVVVLNTELNDELICEGFARDVVRLVQDRRKEIQCDFTDEISVAVVSQSTVVKAAIEQHGEFIASETLAHSIGSVALDCESVRHILGDEELELFVQQVQ